VREELLAKRAAEIRQMFTRIAPRYDLLNRILSVGQDVRWRRRLARRIEAVGARRVLDVCTGTGDVALGLPGSAGVVGCDFSVAMLSSAADKAAARRRPLPLVAGDALRLPVGDAAVDAVTVAFGIRNFEVLERGLGELVRVLRPGGLVLVLEFSRPTGPLAPVLGWWARTVPPLLGRLLSGDREAYRYLPASVGTFPSGDDLVDILVRSGLEQVSARRLTGGVVTLYEGRRGPVAGDTRSKE
jgi:demethylmenaquinone methyltransferase/2-methoxy-6-polyprenyl-1,4-benzoquinol methylase